MALGSRHGPPPRFVGRILPTQPLIDLGAEAEGLEILGTDLGGLLEEPGGRLQFALLE